MAVFALSGAEGLRDQGVETDQQTFAEKRQHNKDVGAEADCAHGDGAVRKLADHHGVHDGHAHPAEFGEDERKREVNRWAQFAREICKSAGMSVARSLRAERIPSKRWTWKAEEKTERICHRVT